MSTTNKQLSLTVVSLKKHIPIKILALLLAASATQCANAAITMYIDDANQQFWFDGSDTGSPHPDTKNLSWGEPTGGTYIDESDFDIASAFDFDGISPSAFELLAMRYEDGPVLLIYGGFSTTDSLTITANSSIVFPYTAGTPPLTGDLRDNFVASIGTSRVLTAGSGFSSISIIPEPSAYAGIAGLGVLAFALFIKCRKGSG